MAGNGWTTMPFDEAVQVNPRVPLERGKVYPFVDMQAVGPTSRSVGPSEMREFSGGGSRFIAGDTLMARITPCLENGKIARFAPGSAQRIGHGSTEFIVIRGKPGITDNDFAYYLTKWDGVRLYCISQMTGSSGRQRVPSSALSHCQVAIPPLSEQEAIACILGALDDKIELNRRMNETLEEIARAIFRSWFVDFDPVHRNIARKHGRTPPPAALSNDSSAEASAKAEALANLDALFPDAFADSELGPIPAAWAIKPLDQVAEYLNGVACQRYQAAEGEPSLPVIKIRELREGFSGNTDRASVDVRGGYVVEDGDVLFSWSGSLVVKLWTGGRGVLNQHLFKVSSANYPKWFYYLWTLEHLEHFQRTAADKATTMGHIKREHLSQAQALVPASPMLEAMTSVMAPLVDRQISNDLESRSLAAIRDALLPKLLSGEVDVSLLQGLTEGVA